MLRKEEKKKSGFMKIVSQTMAILLTVATVLTVSPSVGHASMSPITSATAAVSNNNTTVTVTFNTYAIPAVDLADLKNNIKIERSGATSFSSLTVDNANNAISMTADGALLITLNAGLTGSTNAIQVLTGSIMNQVSVSSLVDVTVSNIIGADVTPPAYIGDTSSNGNNVNLNFDENIIINSGDTAIDTYLKSKISIATDGVNFVPISAQSNVSSSNNYIHLSYNNDMKVILGTNTLIKIASGTLKDAAGNLNAEMILHVTPPVIQSAQISSDNHDVTITFQESVVDNTYSEGTSYLKNSIKLFNRAALNAGDTASVVSGKLIIHFAAALSGANNQFIISSGALKDSYGNVLNDDTLTPLIQANGIVDTTAPKLLNSYLSNAYHDFTLVFDEDVLNNTQSEESLRAGIQYWGGMGWVSIPSDATLTITGKTVIIHFAAQLTYRYYYFQINSNSFKDTSGNIFKDNIRTDRLYTTPTLTLQNGSISHDGRWMSLNSNLYYSANLADQTVVAGVTGLKDKITISTDHGSTFSALNGQDVVSIQGTRIVVLFHDAKKNGTIEVRVAANALSDLGDNIRNAAFDQVIAYNTPDVKGYFLSNTASEFLFEDNAEWRSKVRDIIISDGNNGVNRPLNSSEYTLAAGVLTINKGVFEEGEYYYITIDAEGYSSKYIEDQAYTSSELFYMTAPVVTAENGITAKVNIFNNLASNYYYYSDYLNATTGTQSVVFELMNGTTPVSIVAANLKVNTGTYTANFDVRDAATNANYTVKVFIVNKFNSDLTNVGFNLATQLTQAEYDLKLEQQVNNNNNG